MAPFFERGNADEIKQAKLAYRREYKSNWKKSHRKTNKAITVSWEKEELKTLSEAAKKHNQTPTRFIKLATLGYINKRYVVPNHDEIRKLLQLLAMTYNVIESISQANQIDSAAIKKMQDEIWHLDHEARVSILSPKTFEQILSRVMDANPNTKEYVLGILEKVSHGD